jgi:hypothetical protein
MVYYSLDPLSSHDEENSAKESMMIKEDVRVLIKSSMADWKKSKRQWVLNGMN